MLDDKRVLAGLGALIVVLLGGAAISSLVPREADLKALIARELAPVGESVAALEAEVAEVRGELDGLATQLGEVPAREELSGLASRVEALAAGTKTIEALQQRVDGMAAESGALSETLAAIDARLREGGAEAPAAQSVEKSTEVPAASATPAVPGVLPGETAVFGDGSLRVFVSRLDPASAEARLSIGGVMETWTAGSSRMMEVGRSWCALSLAGVSDMGAVLSATCDDDLPAPEGIAVGNTAIFEEGAVRVYAVRVDADAARLSINGDLVTLPVGRSAPVAGTTERCRVMLEGVDRRHAQVALACGEELAISDPITPGMTAVLGEGAARVFLAGILDGQARFALNGMSLVSLGAGESVAADSGCLVTVEDIADTGAAFSYSCP